MWLACCFKEKETAKYHCVLQIFVWSTGQCCCGWIPSVMLNTLEPVSCFTLCCSSVVHLFYYSLNQMWQPREKMSFLSSVDCCCPVLSEQYEHLVHSVFFEWAINLSETIAMLNVYGSLHRFVDQSYEWAIVSEFIGWWDFNLHWVTNTVIKFASLTIWRLGILALFVISVSGSPELVYKNWLKLKLNFTWSVKYKLLQQVVHGWFSRQLNTSKTAWWGEYDSLCKVRRVWLRLEKLNSYEHYWMLL